VISAKATPPEPQAGERYAELGRRQEGVQPTLCGQHRPRAPVAALGQRDHAGRTDADYGELSRNEKSVQQDKSEGKGDEQGRNHRGGNRPAGGC
jgi:hypothetical protein